MELEKLRDTEGRVSNLNRGRLVRVRVKDRVRVTDLLGVNGHVQNRSFVVKERVLRYGEDALAGV